MSESLVSALEEIPDWDNEARQMHGLDPIRREVKPPVDSSDPAVIKAAQRAQRLDARKIANTVAAMMESPEVRTWMYRLLENCRAFTSHDFPPGADSVIGLARNAAHRETCQFITGDIMAACPEMYVVMLKENA